MWHPCGPLGVEGLWRSGTAVEMVGARGSAASWSRYRLRFVDLSAALRSREETSWCRSVCWWYDHWGASIMQLDWLAYGGDAVGIVRKNTR